MPHPQELAHGGARPRVLPVSPNLKTANEAGPGHPSMLLGAGNDTPSAVSAAS